MLNLQNRNGHLGLATAVGPPVSGPMDCVSVCVGLSGPAYESRLRVQFQVHSFGSTVSGPRFRTSNNQTFNSRSMADIGQTLARPVPDLGWPWPACAGQGRPWPAFAGQGRPWPALWPASAGQGQPWSRAGLLSWQHLKTNYKDEDEGIMIRYTNNRSYNQV